MYGVYLVFLAGKSPNIRCIYTVLANSIDIVWVYTPRQWSARSLHEVLVLVIFPSSPVCVCMCTDKERPDHCQGLVRPQLSAGLQKRGSCQ